MRPRFAFLAGSTLAISVLLGLQLGSASAMVVTQPSCDDLKQQLTRYPVGSFGYQRTKEMYDNQCSAIRPGCTSELDLSLAEKHCTALGQYGIRYLDASSCMQVKCSVTPPSSSSSSSSSSLPAASSASTGPCPVGSTLTNQALACKNMNEDYEYYTVNGCRTVRCIQPNATQTSCPSPDVLTQKAAACKARGADYESYTDGVCKMIRCSDETVSQAACGTDADIHAAESLCQQRGLVPKVTNAKNGCRTVICGYAGSSASAMSCPSDDELNTQISVCKNSGMNYTTMPDNSGCRQVICNPFGSSSMFQFDASSEAANASSGMQTSTAPFSDIDPTTLSGQAAIDLFNRNIINGTNGQFNGNAPVNRAEAAKFLLLACNKDTNGTFTGKFKDVLGSQWYTPFVEAAAAQGIISGYGDGTFKPANTVNRAEFLKMLTKACGLPTGQTFTFKDVSSTDWFAPFAGAAQTYNLFPDASTLLQAGTLMSRFDTAIAIHQYLNH